MKVISFTTEKTILCGMLENSQVLKRALPQLNVELFGNDFSREIFERLLFYLGEGKNLPSAKIFSQDPGLSSGAAQTLNIELNEKKKLRELKNEDVDHCIETLKYYYQTRTIYEMEKEVAEKLKSPRKVDIKEIKSYIQDRLAALDNYDNASSYKIIGQGSNLTDAYMTKNLSKQTRKMIPTGMPTLDSRIGGFLPGNVVLLTAMRGEGKSLLAKSLGLSHFYQKQNVFVANMEMGEWEYLVRVFAEVSQFSHAKLRQGFNAKKNIQKVLAEKRKINGWGIKNQCRFTIKTVCDPFYNMTSLHNEFKYHSYQVGVLDYLNLINNNNKELWAGIYAATKFAKLMAKDLGIVFYIIAQLNDDDHAKYARSSEEDADVWWKWKYERNNPWVTIKQEKARDYDPFDFKLLFDATNLRFVDPALLTEQEIQKILKRAEIKKRKAEERKAAQGAEPKDDDNANKRYRNKRMEKRS